MVSDNINRDIGDRVKLLRERLDIPQADLATALGVTQGQVSHLERGARDWTAVLISLAAKRLGVTAVRLMPRQGHVEQVTPKAS